MYEVYSMCVYVHKFALNIFSKVKGEKMDIILLFCGFLRESLHINSAGRFNSG